MDKLMSMFQKFVEANEHVKQIYPDDWKKRMDIYRKMIVDRMSIDQCVVEAAIVLASQYRENDNTRMWIHATAFEMIEEG